MKKLECADLFCGGGGAVPCAMRVSVGEKRNEERATDRRVSGVVRTKINIILPTVRRRAASAGKYGEISQSITTRE